MLATLDNAVARFERSVAALSLLSLLLLSILQILARNFFDTGFPEIELLSRHLLIIAGLMGAGIAVTESRHIKIDALNTVLGKRSRRWLHLPLLLFAALVAAALSYYGAIFCLDEWEYAPSNERWILPLTLVYPLSFGLMSLHFLLAALTRTGNEQ